MTNMGTHASDEEQTKLTMPDVPEERYESVLASRYCKRSPLMVILSEKNKVSFSRVFRTTTFVLINFSLLLKKLTRVAIVLHRIGEFAVSNKSVVTVGRTHYQTASLVTVGKRAVLWAQEILMAFKQDSSTNSLFLDRLIQDNRRACRERPYVVWDYHVVLLEKGEEGTKVWDLDSTLPFPCPFNQYWQSTFQPIGWNIAEEFKSDRSHMKKPDGSWIAPPPVWDLIYKRHLHNNIDQFISMNPLQLGEISEVFSENEILVSPVKIVVLSAIKDVIG
uniref:Protein N-terminal glutamine amidohydrolase n=1 Tax=Heterorhabditis bacteriophora TaxID=37862 RepID=A0A1I7W7K2_HETBA